MVNRHEANRHEANRHEANSSISEILMIHTARAVVPAEPSRLIPFC